MAVLTSSGVFPIVDASTEQESIEISVLPGVNFPTGLGRIIHPYLGIFDYQYKPDQWVNIDADVIVPPTWVGSKTLGGAAASLWPGKLQDVICEERWLGGSGLTMPISMFRMLLTIFTTPVDPDIGYVEWFPNYINNLGFKVIPMDLVAGSGGSMSMARTNGMNQSGMTFDDIVNNKLPGCVEDGWLTTPVTQFLKIVGRVATT